jgi:hypothetical protein
MLNSKICKLLLIALGKKKHWEGEASKTKIKPDNGLPLSTEMNEHWDDRATRNHFLGIYRTCWNRLRKRRN